MKAIVLKYNKTKEQEDKLLSLALNENYTKVQARPCLYNSSLLIRLTDLKGFEFFKEMDFKGNLINTNYYFM